MEAKGQEDKEKPQDEPLGRELDRQIATFWLAHAYTGKTKGTF